MSKVMTRNPTFVMADTLAIDALQKMVQGLLNFELKFTSLDWSVHKSSIFFLTILPSYVFWQVNLGISLSWKMVRLLPCWI